MRNIAPGTAALEEPRRAAALQRVKRPFHGQHPARSRFNLPSRPGQRLRECGAGTMN